MRKFAVILENHKGNIITWNCAAIDVDDAEAQARIRYPLWSVSSVCTLIH